VEALNSTAISVQWRPPGDREHNGVIRGYLVTYVRMNDRDEAVGEARVLDVMNGMYSTVYIIINLPIRSKKLYFIIKFMCSLSHKFWWFSCKFLPFAYSLFLLYATSSF